MVLCFKRVRETESLKEIEMGEEKERKGETGGSGRKDDDAARVLGKDRQRGKRKGK